MGRPISRKVGSIPPSSGLTGQFQGGAARAETPARGKAGAAV